jgi:hypothetical protein
VAWACAIRRRRQTPKGLSIAVAIVSMAVSRYKPTINIPNLGGISIVSQQGGKWKALLRVLALHLGPPIIAQDEAV